MITKTVTSGQRSAQATISEETRFIFSDKWNFFHVQNMGTGNVYISMVAGKAGGDDGVITILPGCTACSSHSFPANAVYITAENATGSVQVVGSNSAFLPFKSAAGGGEVDLAPYAQKAKMFYPDNQYGGIVADNLNTLEVSGFYTAYETATGAPNTSYSWFVYHHNSNVGTTSAYQRAVAYSANMVTYERTKTSGTWGAWVTLNVGGTNLLSNSGWLNNTATWSLYSASEWSRDTTAKLNGCNSIKHSRTGLSADNLRSLTSANIPCQYGETFTASIWVKTNNYTAIDGAVMPRLLINLRDSGGGHIASYYVPLALTANDTWAKRTVSGVVNAANAAYVSLQVLVYRNGTIYAACPKLERGNIATDYSPSPADFIGTPVTLFSGTPSATSGSPSTISDGTFAGYRNLIIEYTNGSSVAIATDLIYGVGKVCAYHADGSTIDTITFVSSSTFYVSAAKTGAYKIYGVV